MMKNLPYKRTRAKKVRKVIFVIQNYEFDFSDKLFDLDHQKFELLMCLNIKLKFFIRQFLQVKKIITS